MLLKSGTKRRRTQAEVKLARDAEEMKDEIDRENEKKLEEQARIIKESELQIQELTEQLKHAEREVDQNSQYKIVLDQMESAGVIERDEDNTYLLGDNPIGKANMIVN